MRDAPSLDDAPAVAAAAAPATVPAAPMAEVTEGTTRLLVPTPRAHARGPGAVEGEVFYNPAMRFARDVTVLAAQALVDERAARWGARAQPVRALDGLAAAGARGVRLAREVEGPLRIVLNDRSAEAVAAIRQNLLRNGVPEERAVARHGEFHGAAAGTGFDLLDVDPFGTPAPFLDAACLSLADAGVLAVSATDATALAGVYPRVARRRYFGLSRRSVLGHELAVRLLLGGVVRSAARHDKGTAPLLVHATDYYYRAYVRLRRGAHRADASLDALGYAWEVPGGPRGLFPEAELRERVAGLPREARLAGPLWTGPLFDVAFLDRMAEARAGRTLAEPREVDKHMAAWRAEADAPPLFVTADEVAKALRGSPPTMELMVATLRERGFAAARTHLHPKGVKTDAPWSDLLEAFRTLV